MTSQSVRRRRGRSRIRALTRRRVRLPRLPTLRVHLTIEPSADGISHSFSILPGQTVEVLLTGYVSDSGNWRKTAVPVQVRAGIS